MAFLMTDVQAGADAVSQLQTSYQSAQEDLKSKQLANQQKAVAIEGLQQNIDAVKEATQRANIERSTLEDWMKDPANEKLLASDPPQAVLSLAGIMAKKGDLSASEKLIDDSAKLQNTLALAAEREAKTLEAQHTKALDALDILGPKPTEEDFKKVQEMMKEEHLPDSIRQDVTGALLRNGWQGPGSQPSPQVWEKAHAELKDKWTSAKDKREQRQAEESVRKADLADKKYEDEHKKTEALINHWTAMEGIAKEKAEKGPAQAKAKSAIAYNKLEQSYYAAYRKEYDSLIKAFDGAKGSEREDLADRIITESTNYANTINGLRRSPQYADLALPYFELPESSKTHADPEERKKQTAKERTQTVADTSNTPPYDQEYDQETDPVRNTPGAPKLKEAADSKPAQTQAEFNVKWSKLKPGESLVGPDGKTYTKKKP